ncbi:hypothetical protein Bhyg_09493 [Pseudolycoriella hygida]|uniref:Uncharacterized protein n=1 Tax=Pseudolycoriella hygida TaxID=35572 RepID=A0A9Q0N6S5_9DIPT|nr:hypothetical protein Bhyg_09493 [Pseudolycoriella hygida]
MSFRTQYSEKRMATTEQIPFSSYS